VGIPAAIFRAVCGIAIALLIIRGLEIFDVETDRLLEEAAQTHVITAERERIGRDLHDSIIQSLHVVGLMLEDASVTLDHNPAYAQARMREIGQTLSRTIRDIRAFILDLRRESDGRNWREDLGEIARAFRLQTLIDTELTVAGNLIWNPPDKAGKEILAIVREALTNTAKHAQATQVRMTLTCDARQIKLEIADNGVGFELEPGKASAIREEQQGLKNMRERAALIGASLAIDSAPHRGTTLHLILSAKEMEK